MAQITYSNADENRFWLQIIGDYARALIQAFPPDQVGGIEQARNYIVQLDNLLARARKDLTAEQLAQLNREAYSLTQSIQNFFLQMLSQQVRGGYPIFIKPAIINNGVTMAQEYMYLLNSFINNQIPKSGTAVQLQIYWLPIFSEIAKVIADSLGLYQAELRRQAESFSNDFMNLLLFAIELQGISRIGTSDYPILNEQNQRVQQKIEDFMKYVGSLITLRQQNRIPGTLSTLYLDRSNRIACYVLKLLATLTDSRPRECDPASPRISNI